MKSVIENVANSRGRSVDAVRIYFYRHRSPSLKEDSFRTRCSLNRDEEEALVDYLYGMAIFDYSRTTADAIETVRDLCGKEIDKHVVSRIRHKYPELCFKRPVDLGKKRSDDDAIYERSLAYAKSMRRYYERHYFPQHGVHHGQDSIVVREGLAQGHHHCFFPAGTSQWSQPRDNLLFGRLEADIRVEIEHCKSLSAFSDSGHIPFSIVEFVHSQLAETFTTDLISASFKECGVFPFDHDLIVALAERNHLQKPKEELSPSKLAVMNMLRWKRRRWRLGGPPGRRSRRRRCGSN